MSQQLQQPTAPQSGTQQQQQQPGYQAQTAAGQRLQGSQMGQWLGQEYQQSVPIEVQQAVSDLERFESVAEWVKSSAIDLGMPRVAKRFDDLESIAHLEKDLLLRESPFAGPIAEATKQTIQQAAQELQHRANDPGVQEALSHGQQVLTSIDPAVQATFQRQGVQPQQSSVQQPQQF